MKNSKSKTKLKCYPKKALGGGVQGAATGAASGASFGPWGAVAGAVIGGAAGWMQEDSINDAQAELLEKRTAYGKKIDEMNSIYNMPGGYNQQNPTATAGQFEHGGKVGVKLIKGSGKDGSVKSVHKKDFVVPNESIPEFIAETGLKPKGVVTASSSGNTKIIAGEDNKPELLVKKDTVKKIPNIEQYAPNATNGKRKFTGGFSLPGEDGEDDLLTVPRNVYNTKRKSKTSLAGLGLPGSGKEFKSLYSDYDQSASAVDYTQGTDAAPAAQPALATPPAPQSTATSPPLVGPAVPSGKPATDVTGKVSSSTDLDGVNQWHTFMQIANAGVLFSNMLQKPPQTPQPALFNPVLEDRTGQILADKARTGDEVDQVLTGAKSRRNAAGITSDTDLVAKGINAKIKIGAATDKAFSDQTSRNTEILNNANLYNLEVKGRSALNEFNERKDYQLRKAASIGQGLSNVGQLMEKKNDAVHHLNEQNSYVSAGKQAKLTTYNLTNEQLPGQPRTPEEAAAMSPQQLDELIVKAARIRAALDAGTLASNKVTDNSSSLYNGGGGFRFDNPSNWK